MELRKFTGSPNAENIRDAMFSQLMDLPGREELHVITAVTDSAATMLKCLDTLELVDNNVRCIGHLINNAVENAFASAPSIGPLVVRCKQIAAATHKSTKTCEIIERYCKQLDVAYCRIIQPVKTRWHSMADCMSSILRLRPALEEIKMREDRSDKYVDKLVQATPSKTQFDILSQLCPVLQKIKKLSERLTAEKTPTLHLVIPSLVALNRMTSTDAKVLEFLEPFQTYLDSRISNCGRTEELLCVAGFLHPFFKGSILHYAQPQVQEPETSKGKGRAKNVAAKKVSASASTRSSQRALADDDEATQALDPASQALLGRVMQMHYERDIYERTKATILLLMEKSRINRAVSTGNSEAESDAETAKKKKEADQRPRQVSLDDAFASVGDFLEEGNLQDFAKPKEAPKKDDDLARQFEHYLNFLPDLSSADGDILAYWKAHEPSVPDVARLARRILSIPASSASSERLFSAAGRTITPQRTNLSAARAEQLIFVQQNFEAVKDKIGTWDLGLPKIGKGKGKGKGKSGASSQSLVGSQEGSVSAAALNPSASDVANIDDAEEEYLFINPDEPADPNFDHSDVDLEDLESEDDEDIFDN